MFDSVSHFITKWLPEVVSEGGPVLVVQLACSVVALAVCMERMLVLRRGRIIPRKVVEGVQRAHDLAGIALLERLVANPDNPLAKVINSALRNRHLPRVANEQEIIMEGRQAAAMLERGLGVLELVATTAPLLGLLGTVTGMVRIFNEVSLVGLGDALRLSRGVKEALYTTVAGLCIGIPMLAAHAYFRHRAERLVFEIEHLVVTLLNNLYVIPADPGRRPGTEDAA